MTMKATAQLAKERALRLRESLKGSLRTYVLILLCLILCSCIYAQDRNTKRKGNYILDAGRQSRTRQFSDYSGRWASINHLLCVKYIITKTKLFRFYQNGFCYLDGTLVRDTINSIFD